MKIVQNLVSADKYPLKCPYSMSPIGICVHNTANDATAKQESTYIVSNPASKDTSYHFAVDDVEAYQNLPLDRNGWHAGDGANGEGNRKYIAIEICFSKSGGEKFTKAENNTAELIAQLLKERKWGIERVKKHQDFSGKYCPHRTLDLGWDRFLGMIKTKLGGGVPDEYGDMVWKSTQHDQTVSSIFPGQNPRSVDSPKVVELFEKNKTERDSAREDFRKEKEAHQVTKYALQHETESREMAVIQARNEGYQKGLEDGRNSAPNLPDDPDLELNGVTITVVEGNKTTSKNYKVKES